jgi:2-hydroxy-6-oxonona-2,4-dienedioate hydrolase
VTEVPLSAAPTSPIGGVPPVESTAQAIELRGLTGQPVRVNLVEIGSGRPIVFLHGLVGLNEHWEDVTQRIRHRLRCIMLEIPLLDLRGADCSIEGAAALTTRFLEDRFDEPAILAGNSFGGHVAARIAMEHPKLVRALILTGSSGLAEKQMVSDVQIRPSRAWLERKIAELFYDKAHMRQTDVDRAFESLTRRDNARAMVRLSKSARRDHLGDRLGSVSAPTLLIWGRQDIVTPPEAAREFKARMADARLVWFDRCGHAPMMEAPAQFAETVLAFTAELDRRG